MLCQQVSALLRRRPLDLLKSAPPIRNLHDFAGANIALRQSVSNGELTLQESAKVLAMMKQVAMVVSEANPVEWYAPFPPTPASDSENGFSILK